ncbi:MAG: hypothetical protein JRJ12_03505 [Deltaproteobacteria bacterium]|nr:hypothetical protein [Deltaproteobacteria bacterium]MBW2070296.1 hypothetical protein [Deltaproteobacteria bacterium]
MAKPSPHSFKKRQKEIKRKLKAQKKMERRLNRKRGAGSAEELDAGKEPAAEAKE